MEGRFNNLRRMLRPNISVETLDARAHVKGEISGGGERIRVAMDDVNLHEARSEYRKAVVREREVAAETRKNLEGPVMSWKKGQRNPKAKPKPKGQASMNHKPRRSRRLAAKGSCKKLNLLKMSSCQGLSHFSSTC